MQINRSLVQVANSWYTSQGETVPYVISVEKDAEGNTAAAQKGLADRAKHPEEISAASNLAIDAEYYLTQQVCNTLHLAPNSMCKN